MATAIHSFHLQRQYCFELGQVRTVSRRHHSYAFIYTFRFFFIIYFIDHDYKCIERTTRNITIRTEPYRVLVVVSYINVRPPKDKRRKDWKTREKKKRKKKLKKFFLCCSFPFFSRRCFVCPRNQASERGRDKLAKNRDKLDKPGLKMKSVLRIVLTVQIKVISEMNKQHLQYP